MPSVFFISLMAGSPWGGSEELWYKTATLAAKQGWKVGCAVYYWPGKEKRLEELKRAGVTIFYFPNKGRSKKNIIERLQNKISKMNAKKQIQSLPANEYDITVISQGAFEITTSVWKKFYKRLNRYIVLYHNYKEHEVFNGSKKETIQNWISHAQLNLFASGRIKETLQFNSGIKISNADVLINPITFQIPSQAYPYPSLQNGNYCFVMLAALEVSRKAQDQLIIALSSRKWKERNWSLHLYGDGKEKQKLQDLIKDNGMEKKFFLEGHSTDVKTVLQNAHLLLQLTHIDAMPLSVVEAMAIGRPVVASKIGDMPYWINDGESGWISEDASTEQIDLTLEKAWQQKDQWEKMGRNAFKTFTEKFPDSVEENFLEQLESVRRK